MTSENQLSTAAEEQSNERLLRRIVVGAVTIYSFWLSSNRTWLPDYKHLPGDFGALFFQNQAVSIVKGQLWVPTISENSECFFRGGHCYGYFGIFPSLLRIPFFVLFNSTRISLAAVSVAAAAGIGMWSILDVLRSILRDFSPERLSYPDRLRFMILSSVLLGPGGSLIALSQAKMYRESIIWMAALVLLVIAMSIRYFHTGINRYLVMTMIAAIAAANSRLSAIPAVLIIGIFLCFTVTRRNSSVSLRLASILWAMILLPVGSVFLIFYLKFGALTPDWNTYVNWNTILSDVRRFNDGKIQGARYVPSNLIQYLRPDSVRYSLSPPWGVVQVPNKRPPILLPPIVPNGVHSDDTASVANTMPVQLLLSAYAMFRYRSKHWFTPSFPTLTWVFLVATILIPVPALTLPGTAHRYEGDFFPFIAVGTIFGGLALWEHVQQTKYRYLFFWLVSFFAIFLSFVQYSLNINGWAGIG